MQGVLKNSIQYSKKMFCEAPFLSWGVIYLYFLNLKWFWIELWLSQYCLIIRIFLLSIIPLLLWGYESYKNRKAYKLRISTFRESRILPKHEIDHLKALFPDSQIDLFEKVLLPSLSMFYATISEIGQENYYKEKVEAIRESIKGLQRNPALYSNQPQHKYRDIALTAFNFYRILFAGAIEFFCANTAHEQVDKTDVWVLLKRVPARLSLILGAQHWRLYEFWEAVYGDPNHLQLNSDIIDYLVCDKKSSKEMASYAMPPASKPVAKEETSLFAQNDKAENTAAESAQHTSCINAEQVAKGQAGSDENEDKRLTSKFLTWIVKKINGDDKRYSLNDGDYIFSSPLLYEASLFITEPLLNKYYQTTNVSSGSLKQALVSQRILDSKQYVIEGDLQRIFLMRLNNVHVQKTASKAVSIKEVIDNDSSLQNEVTSDGNEANNRD